jgi:hypothetical protein
MSIPYAITFGNDALESVLRDFDRHQSHLCCSIAPLERCLLRLIMKLGPLRLLGPEAAGIVVEVTDE